jgi:hypothetical protein
MIETLPAANIRDNVLYLKLDDPIGDPALRRMAACLRGLRAFVDCSVQRHGAGTVIAALIALSVNMAMHHGVGRAIAHALRWNADMLDRDSGRRLRRPAVVDT